MSAFYGFAFGDGDEVLNPVFVKGGMKEALEAAVAAGWDGHPRVVVGVIDATCETCGTPSSSGLRLGVGCSDCR
jgi:hypothetical protein